MQVRQFALAIFTALLFASAAAAREVVALDGDWRFFKGDIAGAEQPGYNDSQWQVVRVPHDWSIAGPFAETNPAAGAFLPGGVGWYRKHFALPSPALNQHVIVEFDGIVGNSDVWINGLHLGHQTDSGGAFGYELPDSMLSFGGGPANVLTVCVDADASARSTAPGYTGAGICRHTRLLIRGAIHFPRQGLSITTPVATPEEATVQIQALITNEEPPVLNATLQTVVYDSDGNAVANIMSSQDVSGGQSPAIQQTVSINNPRRWEPEHPDLYRAVFQLVAGGEVQDEASASFAIRDVRFNAGGGCQLDGKDFRLKAVCLHGDGGAFGAATPLSIWEARLKTLKSLGVNAILLAQNPPAPEFLGLCDRLGLLVTDEIFDCPTGIDYLGDSPGWPLIGPDSGLLDRTGAISPLGRERQSQWGDQPMLILARRVSPASFSDWTPNNLRAHVENVEVYSNCKQVELFLNAKSLGKKTVNADGSPRDWPVPFAPGILRAVGHNGFGAPLTNELRTAGKPVKILLRTEIKELSPDWEDVAVVRASIVDSRGITVPYAGDLITFKVRGPGIIAAVDNADNASHELFQRNLRHPFRGECVAFERATAATGKITLTATAPGLKGGSLVIWAVPEPETSR